MASKTNPPAASTLDRLPPVAKFGVGALFIALVALLYFVVFYGDIETQITQAKQREQGLAQQLSTAETSKADYNKDVEEKNRREGLAREQKKILPDDPEMPAFLSAIQGVATISGINLTSYSPAEEAPLEFYSKVPMKLTLQGKFHQIVKFFHGVGQLDRITNIENINIKTGKLEGGEITVDVECLATAFRSSKSAAGTRSSTRGQAQQGPTPQAPAPPPTPPPAPTGGH